MASVSDAFYPKITSFSASFLIASKDFSLALGLATATKSRIAVLGTPSKCLSTSTLNHV